MLSVSDRSLKQGFYTCQPFAEINYLGTNSPEFIINQFIQFLHALVDLIQPFNDGRNG